MTVLYLVLCCMGSDIYSDFFLRGNDAYASGDMAGAVAAYEQLVGSGVENPEVFCNLASAFHHLGDTGRAVLNYERAIGLDPDFEEARQNLAYVIGTTTHQYERPAGFALAGREPSLVPGVPRHYYHGALVAIWCLLWGILTVTQRRTPPLSTRVAAVLLGLLAMCALAWWLPHPTMRAAVVIAPESPMRYGPDERDPTRLLLEAGDRVLVDFVGTAWARVETASGARGWVARDSIAHPGPPFVMDSTKRE